MYQNFRNAYKNWNRMQFFVKNQFCVFPNCQTQYIIDNIHSLSGKFTGGGIFFTEDKADNIHCVKTSGTGKTAKTGRYRSNDDRY